VKLWAEARLSKMTGAEQAERRVISRGRSAGSGQVQALLDGAAMGSIEIQTVSKSGLDGLMAPIVKVAAENLMGLSEPDFEFVPEKLRRGMKAVHHRLSGELTALFELLTVYGDLMVCRILAREYPWRKSELTHYEHLRLAWSQFARLSSSFERHMDEVIQHHSEALELFSSDFEPPDSDEHSDRGGLRRVAADCRNRPVDRWYAVAPKVGATIVADMRVASEWPDTLPPFTQYYNEAQSELVHEIDVEIATVGPAIAGFLISYGVAFLDGIERYNEMIRNFRRLHRP
jgi:hypothetical protein